MSNFTVARPWRMLFYGLAYVAGYLMRTELFFTHFDFKHPDCKHIDIVLYSLMVNFLLCSIQPICSLFERWTTKIFLLYFSNILMEKIITSAKTHSVECRAMYGILVLPKFNVMEMMMFKLDGFVLPFLHLLHSGKGKHKLFIWNVTIDFAF